jgi:hypothetical protein
MTGDRESDLLTAFDERIERLPGSVDRAAVDRMRFAAYVLDEGVRVPGVDYRVGIDPLLGVLPGAGDVLSGGFSLYIVLEAARLGVSYATLLRMIANISVDVVAGTVPVAGDLFDAVWKANKRNVALFLSDVSDPTRRPRERR